MNKLKGSSSAVRMKHLIIIFIASLLVALPIRTYQLLVLVNPENGFFENADFTVPVIFGAVAVFSLAFMILSFISKSVPAPKLATGKNPVLGIASLLMAGGFVWDIIAIERKIIPQMSDYISIDIFKNLFSVYLKESGGTILILEMVFAALSVFYFLIFAVSHFEGKPHYRRFAILALAPLCWSMCALVTKLMKAISFLTVSEHLIEIFMFVFAMLFFITFARICSGVFTENSMWGIFGYGFAAALFSAMATIPRIVVGFVGLSPVDGNEFSFTHLAMFIFTVVFILSAIGVGFKHGLNNIKTVSGLELPDDEDVVVKGSDIAYVTEVIDDESEYYKGKDDVDEKEDVVIEDVFDNGIDSAIDSFFDEIDAESVFETAEQSNTESADEIVEEVTEEFLDDVIEETTEDVNEDVVEEATEELLDDVIEETAENINDEVVEDIAEESADEKAECSTDEALSGNIEASEEFVDFADMFIDDVEEESESETETDNSENDAASETKEDKKSKHSAKEKKQTKKEEKHRSIFKKSKKSDDEDEPLKIVSLADLKNNKD